MAPPLGVPFVVPLVPTMCRLWMTSMTLRTSSSMFYSPGMDEVPRSDVESTPGTPTTVVLTRQVTVKLFRMTLSNRLPPFPPHPLHPTSRLFHPRINGLVLARYKSTESRPHLS